MSVVSLSITVAMLGAGLIGAPAAGATSGIDHQSRTVANRWVDAAAAKKPKLPEQNAMSGPRADQGYYLGHPMPTVRWHGCDKTATRQAPASNPDPISTGNMPAPRKGTKQGTVKFTLVTSAAAAAGWTLRWAVKQPGKWQICGVQVSGGFSHPSNPLQILVAQGGYTSSKKQGSTATSGKETMVLRAPKSSLMSFQVPKEWENKKLTTEAIYAVTVFVKKRK